MSRREDRDSEPRRRHSRFDREPSPKRSKRDGKPVTERAPGNINAGPREHVEQDNRSHRRLQDPLPLEAPSSSNPKVETGPTSKESQKKSHANSEGAKHSSDPTDVPQSRSYFQHDEHGIAGPGGRGSSRKSTSDRGWGKDTKDQHVKSSVRNEDSRRDDGSRRRDGHTSVWRHDGFFEMEANPNPPPPPAGRKRPAFQEQKAPAEAQDVLHKSKEDASWPTGTGHPGERKEDRGRFSNHWERPDRTFAQESTRSNRRDNSRGGFASRERFGGGNTNMGRDKYNGRQGYSRSDGNHTQVEKWKHDLFDEANRSPSPKNEEERIAKIEALLAS